MGDFVTLTCPTCGGKLQITPDIDRFACTHGGNEHIVKRSEGMIAIQPLAKSLTGLKRAIQVPAVRWLRLRRHLTTAGAAGTASLLAPPWGCQLRSSAWAARSYPRLFHMPPASRP
jgi:hypothetical protein